MKFWNDVTFLIFNFFHIFFFLNYYYYLCYRFKKTDQQNIVSFYLIFKKPQKPPNLRENRKYLAVFTFRAIFDLWFSTSKRLRIHHKTLKDPNTKFYSTVVKMLNDDFLEVTLFSFLSAVCLISHSQTRGDQVLHFLLQSLHVFQFFIGLFCPW